MLGGSWLYCRAMLREWFGCCCEVVLVLASVKGVTPARRAISCSPICQCMASAARQGMAISSAMRDHMSALNLCNTLVSNRGGCERWHEIW
jgi:hypothetical protein